MSFKEEFIFWRLAHALMVDRGYRILQLFENQKELWLEKLEDKQAPIIRLLCHPLDWGNKMQRDIEFTAGNGERIRQHFGRRNLHVVNIYISPYPPVDDYEYRLAKPYVFPEGEKTTVTSVLLASGIYEKGVAHLSECLGAGITFPITEEYSQQDAEKLKHEALDYVTKKANDEKNAFADTPPFFTYILIAIQVLVFFWLELHGGSTNTATLIKYGAKFNPLIYEGEWWRFITPIFLHIGFLHLAMNTLALYYLGIGVERIYGHVRFLLIYLFAGVTGFIASFLFSSTLSAGASGAIFGCFGALLYFGVVHPSLFSRTMGKNVLLVLAINLVFGFIATGIDNAGHIGGLLGGFLAAGIVYFPKKRKLLSQFVFLILATAVVWAALTYGFGESARQRDEGTTLFLAQDYLNKQQYVKAYHTLKNAERELENPSAQFYFLLSYSEIKQDRLTDAKTHLKKAVELDPKLDEGYYNLAVIYLEEKNLPQAKKYAKKAAALQPERQAYAKLVKEINDRIQLFGGGA